MHIKKLTGKKCYLSPMSPDDALQYTQWLNDLSGKRHDEIYMDIVPTDFYR